MAKSSVQILIANFGLCNCPDFAHSPSHLSMTTEKVELSTAKATAISYTWGEFDRRPRILGHFSENANKPISFNLGTEWDLKSFTERLVSITSKYEAIWMDQACLPQDVTDEEWAGVLMTIPLVFKTLDVIALFPGRLCRCLSTAYGEYKLATKEEQEVADTAVYDTSKAVRTAYERLKDVLLGIDCIYANGWNSWIDRIWPSEELRYSRQISVQWVEAGFASCQQPGDPDLAPEKLEGLPSLVYRAERDKSQTQEEIIAKIRNRGSRWTQALFLAIGEDLKNYSNSPYSGTYSMEQRKSEDMAKFLLGEKMRFGHDSHALSDLFRFVFACEILARTSRVATKAHDYVFSVWADWPSYNVPISFSNISCFELIGDALAKFEAGGFKVYIPSSSPAGLLTGPNSGPSWQFDATLCPASSSIQDTRDVYRRFFWLNVGHAVAERIPLRLKSSIPRSSNPQLVQDWLSGKMSEDILRSVTDFKNHANLSFVTEVARCGISYKICRQYNLLGKYELNADDIFDFVCFCLNLDREKCKDQGLKAVCIDRTITVRNWRVETANITCFGLAKWSKIDLAAQTGRRIVSIAVRFEEWPFYEAVELP